VIEALGDDRLEAVRLRHGTREIVLPCDRLACGFGLIGNTELGQLLGCDVAAGALLVDDGQATNVEGIYAAGECTGIGGAELAIVEGAIAGYVSSGERERAEDLFARRAHWRHFAKDLSRTFALSPVLSTLATPETILCRCEDVPISALSGETGWNGAKLHSRCGMGACQGKICGAAASHIFGWAGPKPKLPISPVRIETLLGPSVE
jgi:NADPH-dependent 2,4-dienoyl-CoA reductase/sulfur reductase-like enzyme